MSQEEKANLRLFCASMECGVWKAIQQYEEKNEDQSPLRIYCSNNCNAYKYNRWISLVNKRIVDTKAKERYK